MPAKPRVHPAVSAFHSEIGKKGGSVKGECKKRGDGDYYRRLREIRKAKEAERK
jgi:hypothetical protein